MLKCEEVGVTVYACELLSVPASHFNCGIRLKKTNNQAAVNGLSEEWKVLMNLLKDVSGYGELSDPIDVAIKIGKENERIRLLQVELKSFKDRLNEKESEISSMKAQHDTLKLRHASAIETVEERMKELQDSLEYQSNELRKKDKELEKLKNQSGTETIPEDPNRNSLNLEHKYKLLQQSKNELYVHWKEVVTRRDEIQKKYEGLEEEVAKYKQQAQLIQRRESVSSYGSELSSIPHEDDSIVHLTVKDAKGRFGVRFGSKRGPPFLNESNIIVVQVNTEVVGSASSLMVDDFVIEINGCNVQNSDMDAVRLCCSLKSDELVLKCRHPKTEIKTYELSGKRELFEDWGVTLGVFIKEVKFGSYGNREARLREYDEIKQVNSHDASDLTLNKIKGKMRKHIQFKINRDISKMKKTGPGSMTSTVTSLPASEDNHSKSSSSDTDIPSRIINRPIPPPDNNLADADVVEIEVLKRSYEFIGWRLIGGNKVGIFVKAVDAWSPAEKAGIKVGWRMLSINGYDLKSVAFSFAMELINSFRDKPSVRAKFHKLSEANYNNIMESRPHDLFYVRTLENYAAKSLGELSFKKNEILCISDSYVIVNDQIKWLATKQNNNADERGTVPSQSSSHSKDTQSEPIYEEITSKISPLKSSRSAKKRKDYYYIQDEVDVAAPEHFDDVRSF